MSLLSHYLLLWYVINNYSSDCVFPYFPIERVDASRQLPATYLATGSLQLDRSCKQVLGALHTASRAEQVRAEADLFWKQT